MAITFDGPNKLIVLSTGTTALSVRDLWSRWADWVLTGDNSKYLPAMEQVGGQDIDLSAGTKIPIYLFLLNGWRLRPQEANHTLNVGDGVLLVSGGGDPFVNTLGSFVVRVNYQQPVQAISFSAEGSDPLAGLVEGSIDARGVLRILLSVASGVSGIIPGIPGTAEVRFKSLDGSKDRVVADMVGSERATVALDPS